MVVAGNMFAVPPSIALGRAGRHRGADHPAPARARRGRRGRHRAQPAGDERGGRGDRPRRRAPRGGGVGERDDQPHAGRRAVIRRAGDQRVGPPVGVLPQRGQLPRGGRRVGVRARANTRRHATHERSGHQLAVGLRFARGDAQIGFLLLVTFVDDVRRVPRRAAPGDRDRSPARGVLGVRAAADRHRRRARSRARSSPGSSSPTGVAGSRSPCRSEPSRRCTW